MIFTSYKLGHWSQYPYMTMWGNHCAVISTALSLYLGNFDNKTSAPHFVRKATQKLLEFTLSMETVITIVYWSVQHEIHMEKGRKMGPNG